MDRFSKEIAQKIANYLDFEQFDYLKSRYRNLDLVKYWKENKKSIERPVDINLDIFPKDIIEVICYYFSIDQFYKSKERYNFLNVERYCRTIHFSREYEDRDFIIGNEESYVNFLIDMKMYESVSVSESNLHWICYMGYLDVFKFFHEYSYCYEFTNIMIDITILFGSRKNLDLITYLSEFESFPKMLERDDITLEDIVRTKNLDLVKLIFDIIPSRIQDLYYETSDCSSYLTSVDILEFLYNSGIEYEVVTLGYNIINELRNEKEYNVANYLEIICKNDIIKINDITKTTKIPHELFSIVLEYYDDDIEEPNYFVN